MKKYSIFQSVYTYLNDNPKDISTNAIAQQVGCSEELAGQYRTMITKGFKTQTEYCKYLKQRIKQPKIKKESQIRTRRKKETIQDITNLIEQDNLEEIYSKYSFNPLTFYDYCRKYNITLPTEITPLKNNQNIKDTNLEQLINQNSSLQEIADSQHKTREWARQYLIGSGWHYIWKEKREQKEKNYRKNSRTINNYKTN